ncbi:lysophospholipid acyltransferase family protein [Georgenia halophila]|uniref:lysophospholipid acyltransferase family protein n=1 Tax=Georgenia halophila TaxID=620889 RepID=UPI0031EAB631
MAGREVTRTYMVFIRVLLPFMSAVTRRTWRGSEHLPTSGGFIAVANHVTHLDPLSLGHFLFDNGAPPHFLAKHSLFDIPVLGRMFANAEQIPVHRGTTHAGDSLVAAEEALAAGACVGLFPEGTLTRDPDLWPMTARTGTARLALKTRVPVVPVAQWGAHRVLPRYGRLLRPFPPKPVTVVAGPPIDLDDLYDRPLDPDVLREATERIMAAITGQLAEIRGEDPPPKPFDIRLDGDPVAATRRRAGQPATGHGGAAPVRRRGLRGRLGRFRPGSRRRS